MPLTVAEKINIGRLSGLYTSNELAGGRLIGGQIDKRLPNLIYAVTQGLVWMNELSSATADLELVGNYLISICRHSTKAEGVLALNNGGTVAPITPSASSTVFPIYITQANFTTATDYNDTRIVGQNLMIYYNEINRYLIPGTEWAYTATGVTITLPGFDATAVGASMNLVIEKVTAGAAAGGSGSSVLISTYYGDTDYYSQLIASIDNVPYNGSSAGVIGSPLSATFAALASNPAGKFLVFKVASSQTDKSSWSNTGTLNSGNIPDSVFRELITFGGNDYYCTRIAYVFDPSFLTMVLT